MKKLKLKNISVKTGVQQCIFYIFVILFCTFPLLFYKYYENEKLKVCEPNEITNYASSDLGGAVYDGYWALRSPWQDLAEGDYKLTLQYSCDNDQSWELITKYRLMEDDVWTGILPADRNEIVIDFEVSPEAHRGASMLALNYDGNGSLSVHNMSITDNGNCIARLDGDEFFSKQGGMVVENGQINRLPREAYRYYFANIPGYCAMRVMADNLSKGDFDYEIRTVGKNYFSTDDNFKSNIDFELGDEITETEIILWTKRDDGIPDEPPHIYVSNRSYINKKRNIAIVCSVALMLLLGAAVLAKHKKWRLCVLDEMSVTDRRLGCVLAALIAGMILLRMMLTSEQGSVFWQFNSANKANLKDYFIVVAGVFSLSIVFICVTEVISGRRIIRGPGFSAVMIIIMAVLSGSITLYMCNRVSAHAFVPQLICFIPCVVLSFAMLRVKNNTFTKVLVYAFYALTLFTAYIQTGTVTYFCDIGDAHHAGAYVWPVLEILDRKPFAGGEEDLYGHYALFIAPILKLFGANSLVFSVLMGIIGVITAALMIGFIQKTVSSDAVRVLTALSVMSMWIGGNVYLQTIPHRWFFPAVILYFMAAQSEKKKHNFRGIFVGHIICTIAILWNMESGVVCGLAWAVYVTLLGIEGKDRSLGKAILRGTFQLGILALEFAAAFGMVELYNYIASGFDASAVLNIHEYMGILMNDAYMVDFHMTLWNWEWGEWLFIFAFTLGLVAAIFAVTGMLGKNPGIGYDTKAPIMAALLSLGLFTFFVNRTAAGFGMSMPFFCMAAACVLEIAKNIIPTAVSEWHECGKITQLKRHYGISDLLKAMSAAAIIVYFSLTILYLPTKMTGFINMKYDGVHMNYRLLKSDIEAFDEAVPENATFLGFELSPIAMNLGRNMIVSEDMPYVVSYNELPGPYVFVKTIPMRGIEFNLYYDMSVTRPRSKD